MAKQCCIVTITDGISPTSMPFNEFVLFRLRHYPNEKQILIQLFEKGIDKNVEFPKDVEFYSLGMNLCEFNKVVRNIEKRYDVKAYHVHEGKSVILFSVATLWCYRKKTIYTLHSTYKNYPFHNKLFCFCASLLAMDIVCVSKTSYKYYPKMLKWLRNQHAMYIQNGVDTERIERVTCNEKKNSDVFTMVYVARLVALKRHCLLFEALQKLPSIKLKLIGTGPLESNLKVNAKSKEIENQIEFLGLLSRESVYMVLKGSNLYVSTSSYEGLPIGVLEAMCCGIPCLVSDIEQHAEIAEKCPSLDLCSDNVNEWVQKILETMRLDINNRNQIGEKNKMAVIKNFSLTAMHREYDKLYFRNK